MSSKKQLIVIGGATATGKTGVAIQLAQHYEAEILSCDSRQFYKEMTIGTAKPTSKELSQAKHYFIDTLSIHEEYTVGDYEKDALQVLEAIYENQNTAIVVGGSGLFIRALCEGLNEFPNVPDNINQDLQKVLETEGIQALQKELQNSDPNYYNRVDIHNERRLIRALGVIRASGQPFSHFQDAPKAARPFTPIYIHLHKERELLYQKINHRVDLMMQAGLLEEARSLYPFKTLKSLQTVGYQEFFDYFDNKITLEEAVALVKRNSRRYAKRQGTWFRKDAHWASFTAEQVAEIIAHIDSQI